MNTLAQTIVAAAAGAAAMYYLDPEQGRRRRALARDKVYSASLYTADAARAHGRDTANRVRGVAARLAPARRAGDTPRRLHERIRASLGRAVTHPKAVHIDVMDDGSVRLTGHVLAHEVDAAVDAARSAGATHVDQQMMVHESAGNIPELQGEGVRPGAVRSGGSGRVWRILALAAPIAILALAVPARAHAPRLLERMGRRRAAWPAWLKPQRPSWFAPARRSWFAPAQRARRYFSALRAS